VWRRLREAGIRVVLIPERAPVPTPTRRDSFDQSRKSVWIGLFRSGERYFRRAVAEFVGHSHWERNHQGLDNRLIAGTPVIDKIGRVRRRPRLGGLLNFYARSA
jgi:hypothetical protein